MKTSARLSMRDWPGSKIVTNWPTASQRSKSGVDSGKLESYVDDAHLCAGAVWQPEVSPTPAHTCRDMGAIVNRQQRGALWCSVERPWIGNVQIRTDLKRAQSLWFSIPAVVDLHESNC